MWARKCASRPRMATRQRQVVLVHLFSSSHGHSHARDTRVAGRKRFYQKVDIEPVSPPWESDDPNRRTVDSPVTAGVDGTPTNLWSTKESDVSKESESSVGQCGPYADWHTVTLDGRTLRTPGGRILSLPSSTLAGAVALEWDAQPDGSSSGSSGNSGSGINPTQMPLMTLSCTALDQPSDVLKENCRRYLPNDTTCYFADPADDRLLHRKQREYWGRLHDYLTQSELLPPPATVVGRSDGVLVSRRRGKAGLPHPPGLVTAAQSALDRCTVWELAALQSIAMEGKSLLLAWGALLSSHSTTGTGTTQNAAFDDVDGFVMAARVEEEFQIDCWGLVEGGHDYDRLNCRIQITSALFLLEIIRQTYEPPNSSS